MGLAKDGYYSFAERGGYDGLVRVSAGGRVFEYVDGGEWTAKQDLARHFVDPGSTTLERIDRAAAEKLAERYGAEL